MSLIMAKSPNSFGMSLMPADTQRLDKPQISLLVFRFRMVAKRLRRERHYFFLVDPELRDIGPEIVGFFLVLDARENHLGARDLAAWILDVLLERRLVPSDAGILIGVGIVVIRRGSRPAAVNTVELRAH